MNDRKFAGLARDVVLGATGLKMLRMGLGGIPIQRLSTNESDRLLENAVAAGINFFDTARIYTDSESKFGRILSRHREQVVIASKSLSRDAASLLRDIDSSLKQLQTDYIDIYQCHNIANENDLARALADGGAIDGLVTARKAGKIRHIGLSGHKPGIVEKALSAFPFATIQIPCNFMETEALAELIPLAKERHVGVIAMKPIGGGNIREINLNFRFIFNQGIDVAIPGMDSEIQIAENIAALADLSPLNEAEIASLQKEKDRLGSSFCRRCEYCMPCPQGLPISFLHVLKNYYFLYDLKDWVWERIDTLAKTYQDCTACGECVKKCPYQLDMPKIFSETWGKMRADKEANEEKK
ncbi:aldo/keto reductase [candidate division KSB1 bacterium]|nr:aldo/keto reductase [Candidatus Aminicenantes bacterium]RQW03606.1 MAG: aldo/keto reductase [candidate division KSB1 bacterium]